MKILLYCRNNEANKRAIAIALEQARAFNGSVELVSFISEHDKIPLEVLEKAEAKLKECGERTFAPASIPYRIKILSTIYTTGEELVRYAEEQAVDTIVMSIQKRSRLGKIFFGSNTQYVLLEAPCKVITTT